MKKNQEKGFTMVELVVVIAIMGVLMAILVPSFTGMIDNMKVNSDIRSVQTIQKQAEMYKLQKGSYPGFLEDSWSEEQFVKDLTSSQFLDEDSTKEGMIMLQSNAKLALNEEVLRLEALEEDTKTQKILLELSKKDENTKWIGGVSLEGEAEAGDN